MRFVGKGLGSSPGLGGARSHTLFPSRRAGKERDREVVRDDRSWDSDGDDRPGSPMVAAPSAPLNACVIVSVFVKISTTGERLHCCIWQVLLRTGCLSGDGGRSEALYYRSARGQDLDFSFLDGCRSRDFFQRHFVSWLFCSMGPPTGKTAI